MPFSNLVWVKLFRGLDNLVFSKISCFSSVRYKGSSVIKVAVLFTCFHQCTVREKFTLSGTKTLFILETASHLITGIPNSFDIK